MPEPTTQARSATAIKEDEIIARLQAASAPLQPIPTAISARLDRLPDIRGVVFDVYGTLFVSAAGEIGHTAGDDELRFRTILQQHQHPMTAGQDVSGVDIWRGRILEAHTAAHARGIACPEIDIRDIWRETLEILHQEGCMEGAPADAADIERLAIDYEAAVNPVWPMPGAVETLKALQSVGMRMGIVSNAQFFTPYLFKALLGHSPDELGIEEDLCVWSYRTGEAKPSPRLFAKLLPAMAQRHCIQPHELLYVGNDMLNDIWTAQQAGFRTALFAGDQRSLRLRKDDHRCRDRQPDAIVTRLEDVIRIIARR